MRQLVRLIGEMCATLAVLKRSNMQLTKCNTCRCVLERIGPEVACSVRAMDWLPSVALVLVCLLSAAATAAPLAFGLSHIGKVADCNQPQRGTTAISAAYCNHRHMQLVSTGNS
jgi:hypothetical protein